MTDMRSPALDPHTRECIERYLVEGAMALNDPDVATAVAGHPELTQQLSDVTDQWRLLPRESALSSLHEARRRLGLGETASIPNHVLPAPPPTPGATRQVLVTKHTPWRSGLIAATAALGLLAAVVFTNLPKEQAASVLRVHTTANGERSNIMLADGTRIVLGVKSQLRYNPYATTGARDIYLEGEAYFDVLPDAQRPLIVHTKHTTTRVLGTEFVVRAYAADAAVRVAVASGRVALENTVLNAGDIGVHAASRVTVLQNPDVSSQLAWTRGQIVFEDTPLAVAIQELSRWYDVQFQVKDVALNQRVISTTFTDRTPDEVADAIATALRIRYERHGNIITFHTETSK